MNVQGKNVLFVTSKPPLPVLDGGTKAAFHALCLLQKCGYSVQLVCLHTPKHPFVYDEFAKNDFKNVLPVYCNTKTNLTDVWRFLLGRSIKLSRFRHFNSSNLQKNLSGKRFSMVWCDGLFAYPLAKMLANKNPIIYHAHNMEYAIVKQQSKTEKNAIKRWLFKKEWKRLKTAEEIIIDQFAGTVAVSHSDAEQISKITGKPIMTLLPLTLNLQTQPQIIHPRSKELKLFHIGAMDWQPNADGIYYFLKEIWPEARSIFNEIQFHFAGRAMPEALKKNLPNGVFCHGTVPNAENFAKKYDAMVAPIRIAGGVRIKILEAIKLGKPVLSTKAGVLGLSVEPGKDFLQFSGQDTFVQAIEKLKQPASYCKVAESAYKTLQLHTEANIQVKKLKKFLE